MAPPATWSLVEDSMSLFVLTQNFGLDFVLVPMSLEEHAHSNDIILI